MYCKYANLTKVEIESCVLPFIPVNRRGFGSRFDMCDMFRCILHKLKTGCQWKFLFIDIEGSRPPFSWQTVYYYYRRWCRANVFEMMFRTFLSLKKDMLDTEKLNLDGTHSLVKRSAQSGVPAPQEGPDIEHTGADRRQGHPHCQWGHIERQP